MTAKHLCNLDAAEERRRQRMGAAAEEPRKPRTHAIKGARCRQSHLVTVSRTRQRAGTLLNAVTWCHETMCWRFELVGEQRVPSRYRYRSRDRYRLPTVNCFSHHQGWERPPTHDGSLSLGDFSKTQQST